MVPNLFDAVTMFTIAFWDAYVKKDPAAKKYIQSDNLDAYNEGKAFLVRK